VNVKDFQEADAELSLRLRYVLERARELLEHFPTRYKTEGGEQIEPGIGWVLEIMVTLASEGADGQATDDACEIAIDAMFAKMGNYLPGGVNGFEGEWIPAQEYIERLQKQEEDENK
jgi:hypothetical protein